MELVRELLLRVEAEQDFDSLISKYSQEEIVVEQCDIDG